MASMVRTPRILNKFYVYDPNVSDTLGGLTVMHDKDDKGNVKDNTKHVLAVPQQIQYWIDQGLMGEKPLSEISDKKKKMLEQITRGRSEDNDATPKRVPRYDRVAMAGAPSLAGHPLRHKAKKKSKKDKQPKKPEHKASPPAQQKV
jgi:hypothetical protein